MTKDNQNQVASPTPWEVDAAEAESTTLEELAKADPSRQEVTFSQPTPPVASAEQVEAAIAEVFRDANTATIKSEFDDVWAGPSEPEPQTKAVLERIGQQDTPGLRERVLHALAHDGKEAARAIIWERFEELHRPEDKARFLLGYGRDWTELSATDPWYLQQLPNIPILENDQPERMLAPPSAEQKKLEEIFPSDTEMAKLKRTIAARYIVRTADKTTSKQLSEWLDAQNKAILTNWRQLGLRNWVQAYRERRDLVGRFFAGITGELRKHGYSVGRTQRKRQPNVISSRA